jgi:hypothetical protein
MKNWIAPGRGRVKLDVDPPIQTAAKLLNLAVLYPTIEDLRHSERLAF